MMDEFRQHKEYKILNLKTFDFHKQNMNLSDETIKQTSYEILRKDTISRTTLEKKFINKLFKQIPGYKKLRDNFNKNYHHKLASLVSYAYFQKNQLISTTKQLAKKVFIILDGQAKIIQNHNLLQNNDIFGIDDMLELKSGDKYKYDVIALQRTHIAYLDLSLFKSLIREQKEEILSQEISQLKQIQLFQNQHRGIMDEILNNIKIEDFVLNQVIYENSNQKDIIYFIISGQIKLVAKLNDVSEVDESLNFFNIPQYKNIKDFDVSIVSNGDFFGKTERKEYNCLKAVCFSQHCKCYTLPYKLFKQIYLQQNGKHFKRIMTNKLNLIKTQIKNKYHQISITDHEFHQNSKKTKKNEEQSTYQHKSFQQYYNERKLQKTKLFDYHEQKFWYLLKQKRESYQQDPDIINQLYVQQFGEDKKLNVCQDLVENSKNKNQMVQICSKLQIENKVSQLRQIKSIHDKKNSVLNLNLEIYEQLDSERVRALTKKNYTTSRPQSQLISKSASLQSLTKKNVIIKTKNVQLFDQL